MEKTPDSLRREAKALLLLCGVIVLFYCQLVFTSQFSFLTSYEGTSQAYSWDNLLYTTVRQGGFPLWDPYTHSGRDFIGEMQTGALYPLKALLLLAPTDSRGMLALSAEHYFFVLTHFLAAVFMFLLARRLGLDRFPALVAGMCFSIGGFLSRIDWPDMLNSAIWLPLIVLFLDRALGEKEQWRAVLFACLAGLGTGMAILGGRIHIVVMDALFIAATAAWWCFSAEPDAAAAGQPASRWKRALAVVGVAGVLTASSGAVQLLPSLAYSHNALRYVGDWPPLPGAMKIPYHILSDGLSPRALFSLIFGFPFAASGIGESEMFTPYFGVLPFFLVVVGVWKNWGNRWVRYLAGVAVVAFVYSLGHFTLLHGLAYELVPYLWMSRIPVRFIYLTHFAMALLAGFGVRSLLSGQAGDAARGILRPGRFLLAGLGIVLAASAFYPVNEWTFFSFLMLAAAMLFLAWVARKPMTAGAKVLLVAMIVCDLGAFDWIIRDKAAEAREGRNHIQRLIDSQPAVTFLKSRPGVFRVMVEAELEPNLGDAYRIDTTGGMSATIARDFSDFWGAAFRAKELLNVRYILRPPAKGGPGAIYEDAMWKVYENPSALPRAWLVHDARALRSNDEVMRALGSTEVDFRKTAFLAETLRAPLDVPGDASAETASIAGYAAGRIELRVRALGRAVLVLSDVYADGWQARINGRPARILRVDGVLKGLEVPPGESTISLRYAPRPFLAGAALSGVAFLGTALFALFAWRRTQKI